MLIINVRGAPQHEDYSLRMPMVCNTRNCSVLSEADDLGYVCEAQISGESRILELKANENIIAPLLEWEAKSTCLRCWSRRHSRSRFG